MASGGTGVNFEVSGGPLIVPPDLLLLLLPFPALAGTLLASFELQAAKVNMAIKDKTTTVKNTRAGVKIFFSGTLGKLIQANLKLYFVRTDRRRRWIQRLRKKLNQ